MTVGESSVFKGVFSNMVRLRIRSISRRLAERFGRFLTIATKTYSDTAIQICVFTRQCGQGKIVGEEDQLFADLGIFVTEATQRRVDAFCASSIARC